MGSGCSRKKAPSSKTRDPGVLGRRIWRLKFEKEYKLTPSLSSVLFELWTTQMIPVLDTEAKLLCLVYRCKCRYWFLKNPKKWCFFKILLILCFMHYDKMMSWCTCESQRTPCRNWFFFPLCGFFKSNSEHQIWWKGPSHWAPEKKCFISY